MFSELKIFNQFNVISQICVEYLSYVFQRIYYYYLASIYENVIKNNVP